MACRVGVTSANATTKGIAPVLPWLPRGRDGAVTATVAARTGRTMRIGVAVDGKKRRFFSGFEAAAALRGHGCVMLDIDEPLEAQVRTAFGDHHHLDCVVVKVRSDAAAVSRISQYLDSHPDTVPVESFEAISRIANRGTMLHVFREFDGYRVGDEVLRVPKSILVSPHADDAEAHESWSCLRFPVVLKPLVASSHDLYMALDPRAVKTYASSVSAPFLAEAYYDHDGHVFKVYVVGDHISVVQRRSCTWSAASGGPNDSLRRINRGDPIGARGDDAVRGPAMPPSMAFLEHMIPILRKRTGLDLLGVDFIRATSTDGVDRGELLVIDVNYFPGYDGVKDVENRLLDLLEMRVSRQRA